MSRKHPNGWGIESTRFHRPNVVICNIVTGCTWNPIIGAYLTPLRIDNLPNVEEARQRFKGLDPILLDDINVELDEVWSSRSQRMTYLIKKFGFIDLVWNFHQHCRFRDLKTWKQV